MKRLGLLIVGWVVIPGASLILVLLIAEWLRSLTYEHVKEDR